VAWCAEDARVFSIVKDKAFRNMVLNGSPERKVPAPGQISSDLKALVQAGVEHLHEMLKVCQWQAR